MIPIVLVDDATEDLLLAERVLRQCKILNPIKAFSSGDECIAFFEGAGEHSQRQLPCLLLIDLIMAPTSGLDVLRFLRDSQLSGGSILVMVSGLTDIKAIQEGYQLGAKTFLVKPMNQEDVLQLFGSISGLVVQQTSEGYQLSFSNASGSAPANGSHHPRRSSVFSMPA